jgi:hypothetical protein
VSDLEHSYRRLLLVYPRWYREDRSDEIVSTLLDAAQLGQRHPGISEAAQLVGHGLAVRTDLSADGALGRVLGRAASPCLTSAGVLAAVAFIFGEWAPWVHPHVSALYLSGHPRFGPFLTVGPVVYLAWLLALVVDLATRSRFQRLAVALSMAVTVLVITLSRAVGFDRPTLAVLIALCMLGLPAILRPSWTTASTGPVPTVAAGLGTLALLAGCAFGPLATVNTSYGHPINTFSSFYQWGFSSLARWIPFVTLLVLAIALTSALVQHREIAGTLVVIVIPWLAVSASFTGQTNTAYISVLLILLVLMVLVAVGITHQIVLTFRCPGGPAARQSTPN